MWLKRERLQKERIDAPPEQIPFEDYRAAFQAIEWTNLYLGGVSSLLRPLNILIRAKGLKSCNILDVGCGGGDIDATLVEWARARRLGMTVLGIDNHPHAVRLARERVAAYPEIKIVQSDFFETKFADGTFDFVVGSLLLHHLDADQLSFFLWKAYQLARVGVILTDLRRTFPAYWAAKTFLPWIAPSSGIFDNDAPLSFRRAYTLGEIRNFLAVGGYPYMVTSPITSPFRMVLAAERLRPAEDYLGAAKR